MRIRLVLALVIVSACGLVAAGSASATIIVANTNDSGPGSLRQAIADAQPGEQIVVPAGTYTLTSGELFIAKPLTIEGHGAGDTVISGGGSSRIMTVFGEFAMTVSGVTLRDGRVEGPNAGAGIVNAGAALTLRGVVVSDNVVDADGPPGTPGASIQGGAIYASGPLTLEQTRVTGNLASTVGGSGESGGSILGGAILALSGISLSGSTIADNVADARGGQGPSSTEQKGGNVLGGALLAIYPKGTSSSATGSTISGNTAEASGGPGGEGGTVEGGAVLAVSEAAVPYSGTTISGNVSRSLPKGGTAMGSGITAVAPPELGASLTLTSSTISGNRIEAPLPNAESAGGNVLGVGNIRFADTIVSAGAGPAGSENCHLVETPPSLGFNLDSADQCGFHGNGDQVNKDPQLGPLQDNGGPVQTMLPGVASPAVDQGAAFGLAADVRGVQRPIDFPAIPNSTAGGADGSDVGAVEVQPSNAITLGRFRRLRRNGTALLTVNLPQPSVGTLTMTGGKALRRRTVSIAGQATVKLRVAAKGRARKALRKKGRRKIRLNVTYAPVGNAPATLTRKVKLVKKHKKHKKRHRRHASR